MNSAPVKPVDWSDFSRRKAQAITSTICFPFAIFLPVVLFGAKPYMPYIAVPIGVAAVVLFFVFIRRLQLVVCPKCGQPFHDQDGNLLMFSWVVWRILFGLKCKSCGAHRWTD